MNRNLTDIPNHAILKVAGFLSPTISKQIQMTNEGGRWLYAHGNIFVKDWQGEWALLNDVPESRHPDLTELYKMLRENPGLAYFED